MNLKAYEYNSAGTLPTDEILTPSESAIAAGFAAGMSGKEIAEVNNISLKTVLAHTQNIYNKTGIHRGINALASWFLETNYKLDLSEVKRRAGAMLLLGIVMFQTATTDFDNQFVRPARTGTRMMRVARARRRNDTDNNTFNL